MSGFGRGITKNHSVFLTDLPTRVPIVKMYLTGHSSLWFWRYAEPQISMCAKPCDAPLSDCANSPNELTQIVESSKHFNMGPAPYRLAVPDVTYRVCKKSYLYTVRGKSLPNSSFLNIDGVLHVASPEYCLVQAATKLTDAQIIELCMEFMGRYLIQPEASGGFVKRSLPLTCKENIIALAAKLEGEPGVKRLLMLLPYAKEGSRSPMETRQYLFIGIPKRFGSYGMQDVEMNVRLELSPQEQRLTGRYEVECDLFWSRQGVSIEYDGEEGHASFENRSRDATKRNVLIARGIRVFTITSGEIRNEAAFDAIMRDVCAVTGHKLDYLPTDWEERRASLRTQLFASMGKGVWKIRF